MFIIHVNLMLSRKGIQMILVDNKNEHDPAVNLALEEYMLRRSKTGEDLLLF